MKFTVEGLVNCATSNQVFKDGVYVSARPDNWKYENFVERIRNAWLVLVGRVDIVEWEDV